MYVRTYVCGLGVVRIVTPQDNCIIDKQLCTKVTQELCERWNNKNAKVNKVHIHFLQM